MLATLGYMKPEVEQRVIMGKYRAFMETSGLSEAFVDERMIGNMVTMANRVRDLFMGSTISTVMSPRTCIMWAENTEMLGDVTEAFKQVFGNKMLPDERKHLTQFYQQTMGKTLVL